MAQDHSGPVVKCTVLLNGLSCVRTLAQAKDAPMLHLGKGVFAKMEYCEKIKCNMKLLRSMLKKSQTV